MRWFRLGSGNRGPQQDPARQQAMLADARQRFGGHVQVQFPEQADALIRTLDGDDGLVVAAQILREFAESAHAELHQQAGDLYRRTGHTLQIDRRNYRPLWERAGHSLRWPLFVLPCGFHPYVQVSAALYVIGSQAKRVDRVMDPYPLLTHMMETLDLNLAGWEFGRVPVDANAAGLTDRLITASRDLRAEMDEPPSLPPPVRELMRRNRTITVYDASGRQPIGGINPHKQMREYFLA